MTAPPPPARKAPYHHGDLKNALIEAALAALESQGWHALSLRDVARQANVSHAAPYRHFPSKEALLAALAERGFAELADDMQRGIDGAPGDPLGQLRATGRAYVALALRRPALFRLMFSGALSSYQPHGSLPLVAGKSFLLLVATVAAGQSTGVVRPGSAEQMAIAAWATVHGVATLLLEQQIHLGDSAVADPMVVADAVIERLQQGLAAPGAAAPSNV
jgi:AcrR family transcriptional regulator